MRRVSLAVLAVLISWRPGVGLRRGRELSSSGRGTSISHDESWEAIDEA